MCRFAQKNEAFLQNYSEESPRRFFNGRVVPQTVLIVLAEGVEEIEAVAPADILRRAGAVVTLASQKGGIHVVGRNGITIHADSELAAVLGLDFTCIVLPGGPGAGKLKADPNVLQKLRQQDSRGGWIAAICAAPLVLKAAGLLEGRRFTAHPSVASELPEAEIGNTVVLDGRLITASGAGAAINFALAITEALFSREKAAEVAKSICA